MSRPRYKTTVWDTDTGVKGLNPYRGIQYVSLRDDYAVTNQGVARHAATLDDAMTLRDRMEGRSIATPNLPQEAA